MPGRATEPAGALLPSASPLAVDPPVAHLVRHGLKSPISRISISWSRGNSLAVSYFCAPPSSEAPGGGSADEAPGGRVVEVKLSSGESDVDDAQRRRIAYGSLPPFAMLQNRKNSMLTMSRISSFHEEWWKHVLDYSKQISCLLENPEPSPTAVIDDPRSVMKPTEKPTSLKAAWELLEIFYVDKESDTWLPERLVDWLGDYDFLLSDSGVTIYSKLVALQDKLVGIQVIEDEPGYWEVISHSLAVGWLDIVVKLLRLHGSYQLDQLGNRETENGLVEAVAVLASTMPRLRPKLPDGKLGQCFKSKPDFVKAWEKWRAQLKMLECSAFWIQCDHHRTKEALRNILQIMLGNVDSLNTATCHWMELHISHFIYVRPFSLGLEGMHALARRCMQLKQMSGAPGLINLILGILSENTEVVLAECSRTFGPWMVAHAMELLTADNSQAEILLQEEKYNLGGISIEELYRLVYAQVLSSHTLTCQIAPVYLSSCPRLGLGLLEILLCKQSVQNNQTMLKSLEICRLYELNNTSSNIMKIAGLYHWKHGRKGSGVYWLQQAHDDVRLNRIAQKLFDFVGKPISDDHFEQWERLIELLGAESGTASGLDFLHRYRDFKKSLQMVQDGKDNDSARQAIESLISLMKNRSTPVRFWLPLLHDSLKLLNWPVRPLLNVSDTNLLLTKLQELSMARWQPDFDDIDLPLEVLSSVRLALGTNLGRAILEE